MQYRTGAETYEKNLDIKDLKYLLDISQFSSVLVF